MVQGRVAVVRALVAVVVLTACSPAAPVDPGPPPQSSVPASATADLPTAAPFERIPETTTEDYDAGSGLEGWQAGVPGVQDLAITSTADGTDQRALFVPPPESADGPAPLLVVLHSWSSGYTQLNGVPYAQWAQREGWAMIHPDFRGINERPESTGSDLAVQDVLDAVDEAGRLADVDPEQVYLVGFSGGGHMSLLMAGRHPERFAGAAAWVPIDDLSEWYVHNRDTSPDAAYAEQLVASCGGDPSVPGPAQQECAQRSPATHLDAAREAEVPVYIAAGLGDEVVPPVNGLRAFNQLAETGDLTEDELAAVADGQVPASLAGQVDAPTYFGDGDPDVLFARESGPVTAVLFDGGHLMAFNPGLAWIDRLHQSS